MSGGPVAGVEKRLAETALVGATLTEVPLPSGGGTWIVDVPAGDLASLWTEARDALNPLGLYPVAVTTWGERSWVEADIFSRFYYGDEDNAPDAVIARAQTLSVEQALERFPFYDEWARENWEEVVEGHLDTTERAYGRRPEPAVVADVPTGDEIALERRLMAWEESQRPTNPPEPNPSVDWYDPRPDEPAGFALLPLAEPSHASAYLSFYGAEEPGGHEALIRLMRAWQDDFGAQLVASWGTMLQFVVSRPPATLDQAFDLAVQHVRLAPCTTQLPGDGVRDLARYLWCGERWFLHERP